MIDEIELPDDQIEVCEFSGRRHAGGRWIDPDPATGELGRVRGVTSAADLLPATERLAALAARSRALAEQAKQRKRKLEDERDAAKADAKAAKTQPAAKTAAPAIPQATTRRDRERIRKREHEQRVRAQAKRVDALEDALRQAQAALAACIVALGGKHECAEQRARTPTGANPVRRRASSPAGTNDHGG